MGNPILHQEVPPDAVCPPCRVSFPDASAAYASTFRSLHSGKHVILSGPDTNPRSLDLLVLQPGAVSVIHPQSDPIVQ